jgi:hypothetical protein
MPWNGAVEGYQDVQGRAQALQQGQLQSLSALSQLQEKAQLRQIMQNSPDLATATTSLMKLGSPLAIQTAQSLATLQEHQSKVAANARMDKFRTDLASGAFDTPGRPAEPAHELPPDQAGPVNPYIPAVAPRLDMQKMVRGGLMASDDPIKAAAELRAENKPVPIGRGGLAVPDASSPGGFRQVMPPAPAAQQQENLEQLIAKRDALVAANPNDPRITLYNKAITHKVDPKSQGSNVTVEAPVQTYTDGSGVLWERARGGAWRKAVLAPGSEGMTPKPLPGAAGASKAALKQAEENNTYDSIINQIDDMRTHVKNNEGLVTGTVGPKGLANRMYEVGAGVVGADVPTPALDLQNKKELIIANVRKLVAGGGQFSNQDALRVERALGTGLMANPGNTLRALDDLKALIQSKRGGTAGTTGSVSKPKAEDFFR